MSFKLHIFIAVRNWTSSPRGCKLYRRTTLLLANWAYCCFRLKSEAVQCEVEVKSTVFDFVRSNVCVCRGNTHKFTLCLEPHSWISCCMCWILVGQCGVTVFLLYCHPFALPKKQWCHPCCHGHIRASRNMPERGGAVAVFLKSCTN